LAQREVATKFGFLRAYNAILEIVPGQGLRGFQKRQVVQLVLSHSGRHAQVHSRIHRAYATRCYLASTPMGALAFASTRREASRVVIRGYLEDTHLRLAEDHCVRTASLRNAPAQRSALVGASGFLQFRPSPRGRGEDVRAPLGEFKGLCATEGFVFVTLNQTRAQCCRLARANARSASVSRRNSPQPS
jgi:hypothetical protein